MTWLMYAYKATEDDGEELRYSLRSVEQNLHMPDLNVMIVGDRPSWFKGGMHVPGNPSEDKPFNMLYNSVEGSRALTELGVSEAIYLSDDHLLMFPQEDVMPLSWGTLDEHVRYYRRIKAHGDWYREAIQETQRLVDRDTYLGKDALSFELHMPLPFYPEDLVGALDRYLKPEEGRPLPFWRTMYGNLVGYRRDVRFTQDGLYYGQSPMRIGTPWVSAIPSQWEAHMRRRASRMFREPSRWESS